MGDKWLQLVAMILAFMSGMVPPVLTEPEAPAPEAPVAPQEQAPVNEDSEGEKTLFEAIEAAPAEEERHNRRRKYLLTAKTILRTCAAYLVTALDRALVVALASMLLAGCGLLFRFLMNAAGLL